MSKIEDIFKIREYRPNHFQIRFQYEGERVSLQKDENGNSLDSHQVAYNLAARLFWKGYDPKLFRKDKEFRFDCLLKTWLSLSECCEEALYERNRMANKFFLPYFGKDDIRDIDNIRFLKFRNHLKEKGFKTSYQKNIMKELKTFFRFLFNQDKLKKMPEFPKIKVQSPMVGHLNPEQQDKVFEKIPERHHRVFWFMRIYPVRPEEAAGLRWDDIYLDAEIPFFVIQNVVSRRGIFKEHTKSNMVRPYPIIPELKWIFQKNGNDFVFTRQNGKPHTSGSLYAIWKDAIKKTDVPHVSLYGGMKHSRGWDLIDKGYSMEDVSLLMGHTTSKHTRRYAGQSLKRMMEILRSVPIVFPDVKRANISEHKAILNNPPSSLI